MAKGNKGKKGNKGGGGGAAAPMQIQQAPYPQAFANNPPPGNVQYIPGLMVPGNESLGYSPQYGGGGYAAFPAGGGASVNDLKDFYKAMAATGNKAIGLGSWDAVRAAAAGYDPSQFGGTSPSGGGGAPDPAQLGAGGRISRGRVQSIMDQKGIKGRNADRARMRITNRLVQQGGTLGLGAARDYARAYAERNPQEAMMMGAYGKDYRMGSGEMRRQYEMPSNDMSSRRGQRGALYRGIQSILDTGDYAKGDVLASLRSGDVRAQPFGTGAGGMGAGGGRGKGKGKRGRGRGGNGGDMGYDTGYGMDQIQPMDMTSMVPAQTEEESSKITMPTVGELIGNWATGFKTKRSSRRRAGVKAQGLSSQLVAPTGSWRYGT